MSRHAVIVGAGVTGLSTAYHLARKSYGSITVVEKGHVGDGASSRAAGIITGLLWSETGILARKISLTRFRELSGELDGYRYQDVGCLNLFDAASWPERERLLPLYDRLGVEYTIMDRTEMAAAWPDLALTGEPVGLFDPLGGYSEPDHYLPALADGCRALGVEIREGCMVSDFIVDGERMAGVVADGRRIEADAVVSTVHVWTLKVLETIGLQLPLKSFVHQRYVTAPLPAPVRIPAVNANPYGGYLRPHYGQRLLAGIENPEAPDFRVPGREFLMSTITPPPGLDEAARENLLPLVPGAGRAGRTGQADRANHAGHTGWEIEKAGLLSFSADGEPVLGPVERFPGLYVGVAFHSGGFAYNPAAGALLAGCVADGRPEIDIGDFSPNRFDPRETEDYNRTRITHGEYSLPGQSRRH
ncbi:MAG: FAD-binding oxidoreductase [Gemmatimonadetes bacterium]|nr:FAD-binding oxidoreductase [Gemmatimonadota bacterium]MYD25295.1 FAD-binding oxidoreductase [Gemmatimonadota bacterium]MYI99919.1 FAD-binding oxidoreductase [Gemmatimonadota bacterium]